MYILKIPWDFSLNMQTARRLIMVNMNSVFPTGMEKGEDMGKDSLHLGISPTKQAAERIFHTFISLADWHVDMHGGELFEDLDFNIEILPIGTEVDEKTRALARMFKSEKIWEVPQGTIPQMPNYPGRGSAVAERTQRNPIGIFRDRRRRTPE